jgi:centrosomal protein CEP164
MGDKGTPGGAPGGASNTDSIILEEEIDPDYVPSQEEIRKYAKWLGMDVEADEIFFYIAKQGLQAPLPSEWKPCKTTDTEEIYYFNFNTGDSTWDHPCDEKYKSMYQAAKTRRDEGGDPGPLLKDDPAEEEPKEIKEKKKESAK